MKTKGTIIYWNGKGWGKIGFPGCKEGIYLHVTGFTNYITREETDYLLDREVEFTIKEGNRGLVADDVIIIG